MKKENQITLYAFLLCILPLMLNTGLVHIPRPSTESQYRINKKGNGTIEKPLLDDDRASTPNTFSPTNKIAGIAAQITRGPITIIGDAAFTGANGVSEGNGTEQNPYLIANWFIDGSGGFCIRIEDTTSYFIIANCTLTNSNLSSYASIFLLNVTNGHLRNNTCKTSYDGIWLRNSSSNILSNNNCSGNNAGIHLHTSSSNTLTNNTCNSNSFLGIYLFKSSSNALTNNYCSGNGDGIAISSSSSNILIFNVLSDNVNYGYGIYLDASTTNVIHSNWIWDNVDNNITGSLADNEIYENFFYPLGKYDVDHDGLTDEQEIAIGTNPILVDTDGDNFMDGYEYAYGSDPLDSSDYPILWQQDFDTLLMYLDGNATLLDQLISWANGNATLLETVYALASGNEIYLQTLNASSITQFEEIVAIIDQLGISVGDTDYDGLSDLEELTHGTSIVLMDTDCDNLNDAFEIKIGTDPLDDDSDGDSYLDGFEILSGTNPKDVLDFPGSTPSSSSTTATPTTDTSTSSQAGSFPNTFLILSMFSVCVLYLRKVKKG